ncbi:hypothetical protein IWW36_005304 [Coemansia brasiliensis]|uniref:Uncharacterized protein n=1 Tax=Coemansia brasiliensis TaxID=2650707 RepID=A0A9W8I481_9FUNG|nr:hypothetical protein IWW36_005304 [Coemansia brasiliensis]
MSICNLLGSPVDRTELDDWESLLYIICWLGIHGISKDDQQKYQAKIIAMRKKNPLYEIPLEKWEIGTFKQVATAKKSDLETVSDFEQAVLRYFKIGSGYDVLKALALLLYRFLFNNPKLSPAYHGVNKLLNAEVQITEEQMIAGEDTKTIVDPFEKRSEKRKEIVESLLKAMKIYKQKAEHVLYKADSL